MSELDIASIKKLKVVELKAELSERGLSIKGKKDELVKRLIEAIKIEQEGTNEDENENVASPDENAVQDEENAAQDEENVAKDDENAAQDEEKAAQGEEMDENDSTAKDTDNSQPETGLVDNPVSEQEETQTAKTTTTESSDVVDSSVTEENKIDDVQGDWVMIETPTDEEKVKAEEVASLHPQEAETSQGNETEMNVEEETPVDETKTTDDTVEVKSEDKKETEKVEGGNETKGEGETEEKKETVKKENDLPVDALVDVEVEEGEDTEFIPVPEGHVGLDAYTSDMNMIITAGGLNAKSLVKNGFKYLWAGARGNKGVKGGKIGYELKVIKRMEVSLNDAESPTHAVRVGWSVDTSSLQLGEEALSYGYESTGKVCASSKFFPFGETFDEGDVIGTFLDLESEQKTLRYTKNGVDLGVAMTLNLKLDEKSIFPHVFLRNMEIELNFGARDEPFFEIPEGYSLLQNAGEENIADSNYEIPTKKEECEVLLMIGLPNAGKSTWVNKYIETHTDKQYCVISMARLLERCQIEGKRRSYKDTGHKEMMKSLLKALTKLYELCPKRNRNYIYDQNNVYKVAQTMKMEPFAGFKRKAVVIVPTHDSLRKRTSDAKRKGDHIHEVPFADLCDMKCEFHLPAAGDLFDEIVYPELGEQNAGKTVRDYQSDGARAKKTGRDEYYPRNKKQRDDKRRDHRYGGGRDRYNDNYKGGGYKGRDNYGSRSNYNDQYRRQSGGGGGNYGGGYRQNQGSYGSGGGGSGGYRQNYGSGGYGSGYGGYGGYGGGSYGGSYGSSQGYGSNYNNYNYNQQSGDNRGSSAGSQWGQLQNNSYQGQSQGQSGQSQGQWGSNQGSWGGYNYNSNYNQSGYGGSGYSY